MIRNYVTAALRNFLKHKSFTFLNVAGLSLGLASSLLILQFVKYERSFDTFHSSVQNIYRVEYDGYQNGKLNFKCAAAVPAVGPALKNNFPEITKFTRLYPVSGVMSYESPDKGLISFREEKMQITDPSIFDVFDFRLVKGNPATALSKPNTIVLTERAAKRYFGDDDPIGKTITQDGSQKYEVTGILEKVPANSHIKFDFLISYETLNNQTKNSDNTIPSESSWGWYDFNTYVLVKSGTDISALQKKWDAYVQKTNGENWQKYNFRQEFILQPLKDIHLYARLLQESEPEELGDGKAVYALSAIAFFILVIAWVNYINLATAKSFERANEVGVRKVMGAAKAQLIKQFMIESLLVNLLASLLALGLVRLAWPYFAEFSGRTIPLQFLYERDFWSLWVLLFIVGAFFSGFYPAIILSSFKPIAVLKGKVIRATQGNILRKSLVVFQFVSSIVLIIGSIVVYQQLTFMRNQDLGVNIKKTLVLKAPGVTDSLYVSNLNSFKNEALRIAGIKTMTAGSNVPGDEIFWTRGINRLNGGPESSLTVYNLAIDYEYVPAFELKFAAGRNFDEKFPSDKKAVLINQALAEALDFKNPKDAVGAKVRLDRDTLEIAGVLENYHQMSLKTVVAPLVFRLRHNDNFYAFKIEGDNSKAIVEKLQQSWRVFFPGNPMDYFFLDNFFNRQYESDRKFGEVFTFFTVLAVFIACLGLFGLASFMTVQRTKEIGIRKVLGSSVSQIVILLSSGFIQLVLIANLIAWPMAWFVMNYWLETFPYRISINPLLFALAGIIVVVIAFLSVGTQTFKAARSNPAETLKHE